MADKVYVKRLDTSETTAAAITNSEANLFECIMGLESKFVCKIYSNDLTTYDPGNS